jgi:gliding motility-associated-like protein
VIATPSSQIEICQGDCVDMSAVATGGNGNVNLSWWEFDAFGDIYISDGSELTECPMAVTTYIVLGEDGCQHPTTDTVFVIVRETPDVEFSVDFLEGCFPTTLTFTNDTELELIESCLWDLNNGDLANICGELEYTYTSPGEYWPTLTVTSEYGCSNTDSLDVVIVIHDYPIADFEWEPNPVSTLENEVHFVNTSIGAVSYNWDIAGMLTTQWPNPSFTFPPEDMSTFPVCLEAISIEDCADTICKDIFIESVLLLYAPNAFTPDQDGLNDFFLPVISGITSDSYIFRIFDRWGHTVFETNQVNDPWLGDFQFGTYYVQNDVYIWQIEARELKTGDMKRFTGNVTIAR